MVAEENTPRRGWTPKFIEALRPRAKVFELADPRTPGLVLRLLPTGTKVFRWYVRSLDRVITIGPWSMTHARAHVTLGEARAWLERLKMARTAGKAELASVEAHLRSELAPRPAPAESPDSGTVGAVAETFLTLLESQRKRPEVARYVVQKDIVPVIGHLPLRSLKKSDCRAVIERCTKRGAKVHAGKVLGLLKQLLDYAENVEDDFINPAARLKAANLGVENNVRDRWLSETELPLFWNALDPDAPGVHDRSVPDPKTAVALRLLLLTAVRSAELRLARWDDLDLQAHTWTIPVANQKLSLKQARRAKPFVIPLGPMAADLFTTLRALADHEAAAKGSPTSPWVLGSEQAHHGHYTDKALGRAMRRLWRSHPVLQHLPEASPHDLRRTARTWLGKLGVAPIVAEKYLNHSLGRIMKTYDQGTYVDERRDAALRLEAFVTRLLSGSSNVAFLERSAS